MQRTATGVTDLRAEMIDLWRKAHENWDKWLSFYEMSYIGMKVVAPMQARRLPIFRAQLDSAVSAQVTSHPTVTRKPVAKGQVHEALADTKIEPWSQGLLEKGASVWGLIPPFRAATKHLGLYGYAVLKARWEEDAWPKKPKRGSKAYESKLEQWEAKRQDAFPFVIEAPHPARVLMPHNERIPSFAIETATMFARDVERMFGVELHAAKELSLIECIYYWDEEWVAVLANNELIVSKPNAYGYVPFTHAFGGQGQEHTPVYSMSPTTPSTAQGPRPEDLAVGIFAGYGDLIKSIDEISSAGLHLLRKRASLDLFVREGLEAAIGEARAGGGVGAVIGVPAEVLQPGGMMWEPAPDFPAELLPLLQFWVGGAQSMVGSEVAGQLSPGVRTATQHALQINMQWRKLDLPMEQLNYMAGAVLGMCARMVEVRGEEVTIGGITATGKSFEGNYDFKVNFQAKDEAAQERATANSREEFQAGLKSMEKHLETRGEADAVGERRRIWLDQAEKDPTVRAVVLEAVNAMFRQKHNLPPPPVAVPQDGGGPNPFVPQPGGSQEAAQVLGGMKQIPGQGIVRAGA